MTNFKIKNIHMKIKWKILYFGPQKQWANQGQKLEKSM